MSLIIKRLLSGTLVTLLLAGCQPPIVKTRFYTLDVRIVVNGKPYKLTKKYTCHFEDVAWISTRGPAWHIRAGGHTAKVGGLLDDGSRFLVIPRAEDFYDIVCPDKTETADISVFVELEGSNLESFDRVRTKGTKHDLTIVKSEIIKTGSGLDKFVESGDLPRTAVPSKHYYAIDAIIYKRAEWHRKPALEWFIENEQLLRLVDGRTYPFTSLKSWAKETRAVERWLHFDPRSKSYIDAALRIPLLLKGEDWVFPGVDQPDRRRALRWRIQPSFQNKADKRDPSASLYLWITFGSNRIEFPLGRRRIFYQPEQDRFINFGGRFLTLPW